MLLYEPISGRFFMVKDEDVEAMKQTLAKKLAEDRYLYVDDVYQELAELAKKSGLPPLDESHWSVITGDVATPLLDLEACQSLSPEEIKLKIDFSFLTEQEDSM